MTGVSETLIVSVLSGVHLVFSESPEVTVLQLVLADVVLSGLLVVEMPGFSNDCLGTPVGKPE